MSYFLSKSASEIWDFNLDLAPNAMSEKKKTLQVIAVTHESFNLYKNIDVLVKRIKAFNFIWINFD